MFDATPNKMPAINIVTLESAYGGGRALLVNRMSSEVCVIKIAPAVDKSRLIHSAQLALFDLRFPGSEAAVKYQGHINETFEQSMVRFVCPTSPEKSKLINGTG